MHCKKHMSQLRCAQECNGQSGGCSTGISLSETWPFLSHHRSSLTLLSSQHFLFTQHHFLLSSCTIGCGFGTGTGTGTGTGIWKQHWHRVTVMHHACSVAFILQSTAFSCQHLESRCEAFLQQYESSLADMTEESFKTQVHNSVCLLCKIPEFKQLAIRLHDSGCGHQVICHTIYRSDFN